MLLGPLTGYTVGVTADRRQVEQAALLERRGARVVLGPTVHTQPLAPDEGIRAATEAVIDRRPAVVVLTTGLGTRGWFAAADALGLGEPLRGALAGARVLVRGPKAAGAAITVGLDVEWAAPSERAAELVARVAETTASRTVVAVQLDGRADPVVATALEGHGLEVIAVPVYRWTRPADAGPARKLIEWACAGRLDAVTFTAAPAVENLFALAAELGLGADLVAALDGGTVLPMCVGPVCLEALRAHGVTGGHEPPRARLGSMVQALGQLMSGRSVHLLANGVPVVIQGAVAHVGDARVELTTRERAVLEVLLERPGAVVSKAVLRDRVWGPGAVDDHAVEVAVARLRRRLGPAGEVLETSMRRGYRLAAAPV